MSFSLGLQAYNGNTALHVAASLQYRVTQLDAVRLLMRKGADPSTRNLENEQPVHLVPDGPVGEQVRATEGKDILLGLVLKRKSGGSAGTLQVGSVSSDGLCQHMCLSSCHCCPLESIVVFPKEEYDI